MLDVLMDIIEAQESGGIPALTPVAEPPAAPEKAPPPAVVAGFFGKGRRTIIGEDGREYRVTRRGHIPGARGDEHSLVAECGGRKYFATCDVRRSDVKLVACRVLPKRNKNQA